MVPLAVAICRQSMRAAASLGGAPGSAITTAVGLTETKAVGASAHVVSTIGKAPAATSASTRPVAGLSATTSIGPCSDMDGAHTCYEKSRDPSGARLMPRQRNEEDHAALPRGLNAPAISELTPRACNSAARAAPS